jgi:homeobox protein cut-like
LSAKAAKVTDLELEVVNLRRTLNQYNDELTGVKNQEVTVRQLRDRLRQFEASVDQKVEVSELCRARTHAHVQERLREREQQLRDELAEREATILEEQSMRDAKLADAERRVRHLQTAMDGVHNELNTLRTAQDDADELRQRQMDMLERDIEEAVQRAVSSRLGPRQRRLPVFRIVPRQNWQQLARVVKRKRKPLPRRQMMHRMNALQSMPNYVQKINMYIDRVCA